MQLPAVDVEKQRYLEIRTPDDERVVTIIEVLSPSNKNSGGDYDVYVSKRNQVLRSQIHFVEIDLRRGGNRPPSHHRPPICRIATTLLWSAALKIAQKSTFGRLANAIQCRLFRFPY